MTIPHQNCSELAQLIKTYLLQEHESEDWVQVNPEEYAFFKQFAVRQREQKQPPKVIVNPPEVRPTPQQAKSYPSERIQSPAPSPAAAPESPKKAEIPTEIVVQTPSKEASFFVLEPCTQPVYDDLGDIRKIIAEKIPTLKISQDIPAPVRVPKNNAVKAPEVILLYYNEDLQHLPFLEKIANAITMQLAPATVISADRIDQEKSWNRLAESTKLRLVIAAGERVNAVPTLKNLGQNRLFPIPDISLYLREPHLKPMLWKALCDILPPQTK